MRVLFMPLITRGVALGTISRCLAVAEILRERGHPVLFLAGGPVAEHITESGFDFREGVMPDPPGPLHPLRNLADVSMFFNLTREDYIRQALKTELEVIDEFKPDVIFSEFKLTAALSAPYSGLPLVSTACTPAHPDFTTPLFLGPGPSQEESLTGFNHLLDELKLPPIKDVAELFFMRSRLKIAPCSRELEPLLQNLENLHYVGYLLYEPWERAPLPPDLLKGGDASRLVYVYFSSGEIRPHQYLRALPQAFDHTEFQVVAAVGSHPDLPETPPATPNVTYTRFVPQGSILEKSEAFIFHGGQNSCMSSLLHGVPSLIVPGMDFERDFNVRGLVQIGAGLELKIDEFTPEKILHDTRAVIEGDYGARAKIHGQELRKLGGPLRAVDLLETIL